MLLCANKDLGSEGYSDQSPGIVPDLAAWKSDPKTLANYADQRNKANAFRELFIVPAFRGNRYEIIQLIMKGKFEDREEIELQ